MRVSVLESAFDPLHELQQYQSERLSDSGQCGAQAIFVGNMRDFNEGDSVQAMWLEHYPGMTEKQLQKIIDQAHQRWNLIDALLIHRCGKIEVNDSIVLIAVWSSHRAEAFEACRFIIEELKHNAPFWKQETLETGKRWVEKNT